MSAALVQLKNRDAAWAPIHDPIVIGKDILELLSSSMYVDPLTIYREYVQNAADAIDEARQAGVLQEHERGTVEITIAPDSRSVRIRDNGYGIPATEFVQRLTSFGASKKRGTTARGFRGVGRLAGLGSCQELVFRSRIRGQRQISELRWDCKALKGLLRSADGTHDLTGTVAAVVTHRMIDDKTYSDRFFEVELRGVIRQRNDQLLNPVAVGAYLAQVAPVPFSQAFPHADAIVVHIGPHVRLADLHITVSGLSEPITRPHAAGIAVTPAETDLYTDVELITIPAVDGATAAVGWVAHHGYTGALPGNCNVRGLRVRAGNIQVGDERLLEELFPEARFNTWAVGEIHVIDHRLIPNGRRDHFEQNVHYQNLLTHLLPTAREIARRCRTSSAQRKWLRDFELRDAEVREKAGIIKQGALNRVERQRLTEEIRATLSTMEMVVNKGHLQIDDALRLKKRFEKTEREVARLLSGSAAPGPLASLAEPKRRAYEHVIGLIYECSANQAVAKQLVDKILARLS
jgi:molecular chaperone HtpG